MSEPLEQHHAENLPEDLPDSLRGLLDESTLASYVRDLTMCANDLHVRLKLADDTLAQERGVSLEQAIHALTSGQACGAQIRYSYQNGDWADTISLTARGLEITRIELPKITPSSTTAADSSTD